MEDFRAVARLEGIHAGTRRWINQKELTMGDGDEKRKPDEEQADVEGHRHFLNETDETPEEDETPDVEGHHKAMRAPVGKKRNRRF
jgi:hypothetical protein